MDLPDGIRKEIYRCVLVFGPHDGKELQFNPLRVPIVHQQPPISRTSRQIRAEMLSIYYSENPFILFLRSKPYQEPQETKHMLNRVFNPFQPLASSSQVLHQGPHALRLIRHFTVQYREDILGLPDQQKPDDLCWSCWAGSHPSEPVYTLHFGSDAHDGRSTGTRLHIKNINSARWKNPGQVVEGLRDAIFQESGRKAVGARHVACGRTTPYPLKVLRVHGPLKAILQRCVIELPAACSAGVWLSIK